MLLASKAAGDVATFMPVTVTTPPGPSSVSVAEIIFFLSFFLSFFFSCFDLLETTELGKPGRP